MNSEPNSSVSRKDVKVASATSEVITVAVCSYNRVNFLQELLPAFSLQSLPAKSYRILVVDNSEDSNIYKELIEEFKSLPNLSVVRSAPPGLSRARNMALELCSTPYIVYLDDDALPERGWLEAIVSAFETHAASIVAGPIFPEWPGPKPEWLPQKYVGCLTILDHGSKDRWLSDQECAYGANMAFRTDALRQLGGFNVGLGRQGNSGLLSEEELEVQLKLKKLGHRAYYAARAAVRHKVHPGRLTRNFFRARMAWQAVSALLRDPPLRHFSWSQQEIAAAAAKLGLEEFLSRLMKSSDGETFSTQLDIIYHLFAVILESKDSNDSYIENGLAPTNGREAEELISRPLRNTDVYELNAPVLPWTKHLIIEGKPAHFYLYALYGDLPETQLLLFPHPMWHSFDEALRYVQRSLTHSLKTLTFVTVDPLIYGPSRHELLRLLRESPVSCFGILHRLPENGRQEEALKQVGPHLAGIIVLAEELTSILRERFGLLNAYYLPHHAPLAPYVLGDRSLTRAKIGATEAHFVFSILGEARRGKGIDLLLESLAYVPREISKRIFFLIAGRAQHLDVETIERSLAEANVAHYIDLRSSDNPLKYDVLSDREFGEYIGASDAGLLLYRYDQKECMSGVAPNYVWAKKPLVSFSNTVIGQIIANHDLGIVIDGTKPQDVGAGLASAVEGFGKNWQPGSRFYKYRDEIAAASVLNRLGSILNQSQIKCGISADGEDLNLPDSFRSYLSNLPLLHTWDGGQTWNTGGFEASHLSKLHQFLRAELPASSTLLETGAGNSTISLLFLDPKKLISIAPDAELFNRIREYCRAHSIPDACLEAHVIGSEWALPQLAANGALTSPSLDFALIDGCHNWPLVFVDFFYVNYMLKPGGLIMIDDINLHSVKELARLLSEQPEFRLEVDLGKSLVFRRLTDARSLGEWTTLPYIGRMTKHYEGQNDPFSLT